MSRCATFLACLLISTPGFQVHGPGLPTLPSQLSGVVRRSDSMTAGLPGAQVTLAAIGQPPAATAVTDSAGRFTFGQLADGYYLVQVSRSGFLSTTYGSLGPNMPGLPVLISANENKEIVIAITPGAAISGAVRDQFSIGFAGARVIAHRTLDERGGRWQTLSTRRHEARTDSMGRYTIEGLIAGAYVVAVVPDGNVRASSSPTSDQVDAMLAQLARGVAPVAAELSATAPAPTFYPATSVLSRASLVVAQTGEVTSGIDIQFLPVRVASIQGIVYSQTGGVMVGVDVRVVPDGSAATAIDVPPRRTTSSAKGEYAINELRPGSYRVMATVPGRPGFVADGNVELAEGAEEVIDLRLRPITILSGYCLVDGRRALPQQLAKTEVIATPLNALMGVSASATTIVRADGTFQIEGLLPGRYRISVRNGIAERSWLKSALADGREVLDDYLEINAQPAVELSVDFSTSRTSLVGSIKDKSGIPAPYLLVVMFPRDPKLWSIGSRRVAVSRVAPDGGYLIRDMPAGEYYVAALTELDEESFGSLWYLEGLRLYGILTVLTDGEQKRLDLATTGRLTPLE